MVMSLVPGGVFSRHGSSLVPLAMSTSSDAGGVGPPARPANAARAVRSIWPSVHVNVGAAARVDLGLRRVAVDREIRSARGLGLDALARVDIGVRAARGVRVNAEAEQLVGADI